jgi:predicted small lipoprotein YifL
MVPANPESLVNRCSALRLAAVGVCAAVLLAGCGRKGPLDPPPGAWVTQPGQTPHVGAGAPANAAQPAARRETDDEGRPIAPAGPQRRIPADWLID